MTTNHLIPVTTFALDAFIGGVQKIVNNYFAKHLPNNPVPTITFEVGPKNIRVIKNDVDKDGKVYGRSVYCFVEKATGNILKDAGWKGPVKNGVRGNINKPGMSLENMGWTGPNSLR